MCVFVCVCVLTAGSSDDTVEGNEFPIQKVVLSSVEQVLQYHLSEFLWKQNLQIHIKYRLP